MNFSKITNQEATNKIHEHINKFRESVGEYQKNELQDIPTERPIFRASKLGDVLGLYHYNKIDPTITNYLSDVGYKDHEDLLPIDRLELMFYHNDVNKINPATMQTNPTNPTEPTKEKSHLGRNLAIGAGVLGAGALGAYLWRKHKKKQALQKTALSALSDATLGAGAGALLGHVFSNRASNKMKIPKKDMKSFRRDYMLINAMNLGTILGLTNISDRSVKTHKSNYINHASVGAAAGLGVGLITKKLIGKYLKTEKDKKINKYLPYITTGIGLLGGLAKAKSNNNYREKLNNLGK